MNGLVDEPLRSCAHRWYRRPLPCKSPAMIDVLLNAVLPVFAVVAVGYAFGWRGIFDAAMAQVINRFVFFVAVPILLFRLIATAPIATYEWLLILAYLAAEITLYAAGFLVARLLFRRPPRESLLLGMATAFGNHVFYVLPIAQQIYGPTAAAPIVAMITLDAIVLFGGTVLILEASGGAARGASRLRVARTMAVNPQIIAIAGGLVAIAAGLPLAGGLDVFTRFVGDSAAPVSLFAVGVLLAAPNDGAGLRIPLTLSALKLGLMPVIAWLLFIQAFPISAEWSRPAMLVAAGPTGVMPFVLALQYNLPVAAISRTILITTVGSLLTVTAMAQL